MNAPRHPQSPVLDHCPQALPALAYHDADWFEREQSTIWANNWICVGRSNDLKPGTMEKRQVGRAAVIICREPQGELRAYHNSCRHRGSELCLEHRQELGKLITCPYHAWSYAVDDGRLVSLGFATPTADFRKQDYGLSPVSIRLWNGFVFVCLSPNARELAPDAGLSALDNWPMDDLVTGHRLVKSISCNWKTFWDNYNECLHCPGIHPELCDMVPIYGQGIMAENEAEGWAPGSPAKPVLKQGAETWTLSGKRCGPVFPGLTEAQRAQAHTYVTFYPTMYVVAHVDYVRAVRLVPTGPETTELTAEWYFARTTLEQPGFDASAVADFARLVLEQDAAAAEMNQRGLRSPSFKVGRLMPQEYALRHFRDWVLAEMEREEMS